MSEYVIREGVVLEEICGRYLLISTRAIRDKCHYVLEIEPMIAYYFDMLEKGFSIDEMVEKASIRFPEVGTDTLRTDILDLIADLKKAGYLLSDDEMNSEK